MQGKLIRIWCQGFHPLCGVRRSPDWLISRLLCWLSYLNYSNSFRFASLEAWTYQSQGKSRHFTIVLWQKTLGFCTHSIGCLEATRGRSNWKMVSVHFFCFQLFNYCNPLHKIYCSRQGNRVARVETAMRHVLSRDRGTQWYTCIIWSFRKMFLPVSFAIFVFVLSNRRESYFKG